MYKILLADEEGVALKALEVMIDSDYSEECDIRIAANAQQIQELFPKFLPDILFVNMQMAGVYGISTIRKLRNQNPKCLFIITSYSNRIDFGQEGKNLGVYDYMAKPYHREKVHALLKNCFAHITAVQKYEETMEYNRQKLEEAIPMIEGGMISELVYSDGKTENFFLYKSFLNIDYDYGWVCDFKYSQITEHGTMCNPIGSVIQLYNSLPYFRKILKAFYPSAIIGPIMANHIVFLVPCHETSFTPASEEMRNKRLHDLTYQLHRKLSLRFRFSASKPYPMKELPEAMAEVKEKLGIH